MSSLEREHCAKVESKLHSSNIFVTNGLYFERKKCTFYEIC